ncbi:MAG: RNA degradosome polyphosphate kinase [Lachnospiraceae bacterium]|nr:RNA degradosome polyphosphate kinase [Lachnospiraceae bacterium]
MQETDYRDPNNYYNRELSWVLFDKRVLSEAVDESIPLLERGKFLSITASNLDEFFMIRVASLMDMCNAGYKKPDIAGMTPKQQLRALNVTVHELVDEQYSAYNLLSAELKKNDIEIMEDDYKLNDAQKEFVDIYFRDMVYPVLTPMAVDSSRPFPLIRNKSLNIGALVRGKKSGSSEMYDFAAVQVPSVLPRLVEVPSEGSGHTYMLLEQIIERNMDKLFLNYDIVTTCRFRVMRNADLSIEEEEAEDLLKEIEKLVKKRQWGAAIRLEIQAGADMRLMQRLKQELGIKKGEVFKINGPLDLTFLMKLYGMVNKPGLKISANAACPVPEFEEGTDFFAAIRKKDILVHHPYQSFEPVIEFVRKASEDPKVLAIKQTLYRVSGNSPIVAALAAAAENGKQVTVLVELKARFDEENNIVWAKKLEQAGCHVIYGLVGLKTHSKITLVVRLEEDGIHRYVHLGTGNYNDATAKLYTDVGLFTGKEPFGEDATAVFNMLSGYSEPTGWNKLSVAPLWLKDRFLYLIGRERDNAINGRRARIIAKMNSLCDPDMIAALYEASSAGVQIDLIVRGICSLKTGIKGVSDNIKVRSIVGNYLEHSRIFYFENEGRPEVYCGSADWMPRNLERRVEILFPVEEPELVQRLIHILDVELKDNRKAHMMQDDGSYSKIMTNRKKVNSQEVFAEEAAAAALDYKKSKGRGDVNYTRRFTPETSFV